MAKNRPRKPRRDLFDHLERDGHLLSQSEKAYTDIQANWALARQRRDEFFHECSHLPKKLRDLEVVVRPLIGRTPYRLELLIRIPEGVKSTDLHDAVASIVSWRECLTNFQGPRALLGLEGLARLEKQNNGKYKFIHAEPLTISNALNRELATLLEQSEFHKDDLPPADPPYNSNWCLEEACELLHSWTIKDPEGCIKRALKRLQAKENVFETRRARNGIETVLGPFTASIVDKRIRAWRRHLALPTCPDPTSKQ